MLEKRGNNIETAEAAYRKVISHLLNHHFEIINIEPINENRYFIVKARPFNVLITYKRDFFMSFGKMFKSEGESGIGDTLNSDDLKIAVQENVQMIYAVFPDGKIYSITRDNFLSNSHVWTNKEGKRVRSISIHKYSQEYEKPNPITN